MSAPQETQTYDPRAVEARAPQHWAEADAYRVTESTDKPAFYACSMLPPLDTRTLTPPSLPMAPNCLCGPSHP